MVDMPYNSTEPNPIYLIYMYKEDLALNRYAIKPNPTKSYIFNIYVYKDWSLNRYALKTNLTYHPQKVWMIINVIVILRLELKLPYYNVIDQHINYDTMKISFIYDSTQAPIWQNGNEFESHRVLV